MIRPEAVQELIQVFWGVTWSLVALLIAGCFIHAFAELKGLMNEHGWREGWRIFLLEDPYP